MGGQVVPEHGGVLQVSLRVSLLCVDEEWKFGWIPKEEDRCVARFSTVGGEKGSPDTARDPRGFSIKFYTEEGNWDWVYNNTPVFLPTWLNISMMEISETRKYIS